LWIYALHKELIMALESIIPVPDVMQAKRVLAVQPHYDDNDIAAGGTLAALHAAGAEIVYLTVTDDLMGVIDASLSPGAAAAQLKREQEAAGKIIGVSQHYWLGYPDAGKYDYFELRGEIIKHIRLVKPDFIFAPDPWLAYEAHRDHIQTGLATAEAAINYELSRLPSSDPSVDAAYDGHELLGVAFYYTREPNTAIDISHTREKKEQAVRCYQAQFSPDDMAQLMMVLELKSRQFAEGRGYSHAEALKVLHPTALHCGI
jgi:LmbE family N-acetylglucosaminyl deacetylase